MSWLLLILSKMRWAEHVARMGNEKVSNTPSVRESEQQRPLG